MSLSWSAWGKGWLCGSVCRNEGDYGFLPVWEAPSLTVSVNLCYQLPVENFCVLFWTSLRLECLLETRVLRTLNFWGKIKEAFRRAMQDMGVMMAVVVVETREETWPWPSGALEVDLRVQSMCVPEKDRLKHVMCVRWDFCGSPTYLDLGSQSASRGTFIGKQVEGNMAKGSNCKLRKVLEILSLPWCLLKAISNLLSRYELARWFMKM